MENSVTDQIPRNYKFKSLKVYGSTEWLADNKKKYRQVFDRHQSTYIYAELSFYNKLFDEKSWEVDVELKCFSMSKGGKEICSLNLSKKVSKYDHVAYVREGWGNKRSGAFWKKGSYFWEAWMDGEKVGTKYFYIEEADSKFTDEHNPYLEINSLKLYEGQYDDVNPDERKYFKTFAAEDTQYVYSEIKFRNLNKSVPWQCELFVKFYNEARELKGEVVRLVGVKREQETIEISAGWGTNVKGSWREGQYTVEVIFMDRLMASLPFEIGSEIEEGVNPVILPDKANPQYLAPDEDLNVSFEELMSELDDLIGLHQIKKQIREHATYIQFLQLRKDKGFEERERINLHAVFTGNPGTGKTTIAEKMGRLYRKMGLLSKGHVHQVDRVDLVGEYIGQTAPKVKEAIDRARGGVLFIDEAYALARANDDTKDFGREVIEILMKEMSNGPGDLAVIVAGYPEEMEYFMNSNPGLKSRFKIIYTFHDYMPQELYAIADYASRQKEVVFSRKAMNALKEIILDAFRKRDKSFGNARFVYDLVDKAKINLGLRAMQAKDPEDLSSETLALITEDDVTSINLHPLSQKPDIPIDQKLLDHALKELNELIGLTEVKKVILEMVEIVKYYRITQQDVLNSFFLHTIFIGNPGTGKTSVARILAKIYKALGILERGHMIETDRQGLVAAYIGQTAIKTKEKIDEARGGVLFIDEAYALTSGSHQDFGQEAIQTLLKRMEDDRGKFYVFAAGYPDRMEKFLKANPGLSSRFDRILKFEDYSSEEMKAIAQKMISDHGLRLTSKALRQIGHICEEMDRKRDDYFGNARTVRTMVDEIIRYQRLRLAKSIQKNVSAQKDLVVFDDVEKVNHSEALFQRKSIGFRRRSR
ncbi:MAG: AAA family ATPase [Saprospiraceae bacterium]|nr:AAA family ATPase [Saprospiraceae bacterium]